MRLRDGFLRGGAGRLAGALLVAAVVSCVGASSSLALTFSEAPGSPFRAAPETVAPNASALGGLLATANNAGSVSVFAANQTTGALTGVPGSPFTTGEATPAFRVAFSPSGALLATADGAAGVSVFAVNQTTGALTEVPGSPFNGGGPATPISP